MREANEDILNAARQNVPNDKKAGFQLGRARPAGGPIPPRVYIFYVKESAGVYSSFSYGDRQEAYTFEHLYDEDVDPVEECGELLKTAFTAVNDEVKVDLLASGADEIIDSVSDHVELPESMTLQKQKTDYIP